VSGHPPAPWRLTGPAAIVPALVPLARARAHVPADLTVICVAPGHTLGGFVAVTYEQGSTLMYDELVVCGALVRTARGPVGLWVSALWVDSPASVSGGRSIWKLPKDLADFTLDRRGDGTQRFAARADGATLVRLAAAAPRFRASLPAAAPVPMISGAQRARFFTLGRSGLSAGPARVRVDVPPDSPLAELGFTAAPVAVSGRAQLVMDAPRPV
jgi:acetoacetate decarboxylase